MVASSSSDPKPARRRRRLLLRGALVVAVLTTAAAAWAIAGTHYDEQALKTLAAGPRRGAPAWSRPCWRRSGPPYHALYTLACARVRGRVLVREERDPDGDGDSHLVVLAGPRLVTLKFRHAAGVRRLPGPGSRVAVTGSLSEGAHGIAVVDVQAVAD